MVLWQQIFFILVLMIFFLKFLIKRVSKSSFFFFLLMCRDPVLELQFVRNSIAFRNSVSADRNLRPAVDDES